MYLKTLVFNILNVLYRFNLLWFLCSNSVFFKIIIECFVEKKKLELAF